MVYRGLDPALGSGFYSLTGSVKTTVKDAAYYAG